MATMPIIFPSLKWYLVLCSYLIAPALAFCCSYATGLTVWRLALTDGKIGLFIIASLVGSNDGVIAGLVACGVMLSITSTAADLMQDFKTGYLTESSTKSVCQSLGGNNNGVHPSHFGCIGMVLALALLTVHTKQITAVMYLEMAILGIEGFAEIPKHCPALCL